MHKPPNRRIRFRMYGGVGGVESRDSPLSRLTVCPRTGYLTHYSQPDTEQPYSLSDRVLSFTYHQLDLFSPDDGYFEYSAVATNLSLTPQMLWYFAAGRGAKTFAELKGEFALDVVPTNHYGANSAWLQLSILAHNLMRSFQLHTTLATPKPRSRKRTYSYRIASIKTLRFLLINRAARLARISGRKLLRFSSNPATETLYHRVAYHLAA